MRSRCLMCAFAAVLMGPATSNLAAKPIHGPIETDAQLAAACQEFLVTKARDSDNALTPVHHCRNYLSGFIAAYGVAQQTELDARIMGTAPASTEERMACFRMPDYLSFHDFAMTVVDYTVANPEYKAKPAYITTAAALASKFPCK